MAKDRLVIKISKKLKNRIEWDFYESNKKRCCGKYEKKIKWGF